MTDHRLDPRDIEAIAESIALLVAALATRASARQWLSVEEVAEAFGRSRDWVRDHAEELGGRKIGGPKAPWSFPASCLEPDPASPPLPAPERAVSRRRKPHSSVPLLPIRDRG